MENVFEFTEKKITAQDIKTFEDHFQIKLPADYKNHLLQYNGGVPDKDSFELDKTEELWLSRFYSLKYGKNNLEDAFTTLKINEKILPDSLFPFAIDMGGNHFCISLAQEGYGKIYYCEHDTEDSPRLISNSFAEFMNSLKEDDSFD
jgi:cell wall assembly regulator SMI1